MLAEVLQVHSVSLGYLLGKLGVVIHEPTALHSPEVSVTRFLVGAKEGGAVTVGFVVGRLVGAADGAGDVLARRCVGTFGNAPFFEGRSTNELPLSRFVVELLEWQNAHVLSQ